MHLAPIQCTSDIIRKGYSEYSKTIVSAVYSIEIETIVVN